MSKVLAFLFLLGGAAGFAQEGKPAEAAKAPAPGSTEAVAPVQPSVKTYVIGAEDMLYIRVWREAELTGPYPVRPDGKISMPLVSEILAAGLTPEELCQAITKGLGKYLTQPEVSVSVTGVNSKKYFISGEGVQKTGAFPLTVPTTVLEALVNAGGFREFAKPKKIIILRNSQKLNFNYKEVVEGKKMAQNILLESGDHIIVP